MLDTITVSLNIRNVKRPVYFDPKRSYDWSPHISHIIAGGRSKMRGKSYVCHYRPPTIAEKRSGEYFPKVKLLEAVRPGGIQQYLYITFSAPKLIFGNNFNELEDRHLTLVCKRLSQRLHRMGIDVSPIDLQNANVSQIHYSKNIFLIGQPINEVFCILRKARPPHSKNYRYEQYSSYFGSGQSVYIYTKQHGLCFYDKKAESRKNKGISNKWYSDAWELPKTISVLRIESRCNTPADIRKTLNWAGLSVPASLTFEALFNSDISQAVLLKEFEVFRTYLPPLKYCGSLSSIVKSIKTHNPTFSIVDIANAAIIVKLIDELGSKNDVRTLLKISPSTWCRREELLKRLKILPSKANDILDEIERQLRDFIPM